MAIPADLVRLPRLTTWMIGANFITNEKHLNFTTMKKFIKFIPAALAVVALASCSNDDLFEKNGTPINKGKAISVFVEGNDATRSGIQEGETSNQFVWTEGDEFKLYGVSSRLTNSYVFAETTPAVADGYTKASVEAYLRGTDNLAPSEKLAYALYPSYDNLPAGNALKNKNFFNSEYFSQFEMVLPAEWNYDTDLAEDGVYYAQFPMWGEADTEGNKVTFKYTTAFMRLELSGLSASSTAEIILTADKQLSGRFVGNVKEGGDPNGADVPYPALEAADAEVAAGTYNLQTTAELTTAWTADVLYSTLTPAQLKLQQVKINLDRLSNNDKRIIYLPIPAQNYGLLSIVLNYPDENRQDVIREAKALNLEGKRGAFGKITKSYSVTDQFYYPSDINQELYDNRTKTNTLNYKSDVVMTVDNGNGTLKEGGNTVMMPAMATDQVILNFINTDATAINGPANTLYIKDRDASAPFTKKLVINTKSIKVGKLEINLPQADVVLIGGDDTNGLFGKITVKAAKSLTFGDNNVVTKQATSTQVDVDEDAVSPITVLGKAAINKIIFDNASASLTVGAVKDAATNEYYDDASVTTVTFNKNNPSVTVQGKGSISFLNSTFTPSASNKAAGSVITSGAAYIKNVTKAENFEFESTWDGVSKAAAAAVVGNNVYTAAQLATYLDATGAVTINLNTDVDLQNKYWAGINAGANAFTLVGTNNHKGNNLAGTRAVHEIKNLNLSGDANSGLIKTINDNAADYVVAANSGIGFVKAATTVTVTNLKITDASCALTKYNDAESTAANRQFIASNIGALAGYATGAVINGLTVKLAGDNFGYTVSNKATNIGGIIGNLATAAVTTITKTTVSATGKIRGYYNLGGFIGGVTATVAEKTITINGTGDNACSANLGGFTVDYNNGKTIDKNVGRIGGIIGSAGVLAASGVYYNGTINETITLTATANVSEWPDLTKNKIIQGTAPDFDYLTYQKKNDLIGYCGDQTTAGKIKFGDTTKTTPLTKPGTADQSKALYWFE